MVSPTGNNEAKMIRPKIPWCLLAILLLTTAPISEAQQPTKVPRIGYLAGASLSAMADRVEAFRHGLRELGYVEGKTIVIEWRGADGNRDRQRALAGELVRLKVDVIVTAGAGGTRAAIEATNTIPIVMTQVADPIQSGFVISLARPGGKTLQPEIT